MITIKEKSDDFFVEPVNATINDDYIIPGISGVSVDTNMSYHKMKSLGSFNDNLFVFINDLPDISIEDNYDKYVLSSNKVRREVSLVFVIDDLTYFDKYVKIAKNNNVKLTFFVDGVFLDKNMQTVMNNKDYILLENYGYNKEYSRSKIKYVNNLINNITDSRSNFCMLFEKDLNVLDMCSKEKMHTVIPKNVSSTNPYVYIKENLNVGNIYYFENNNYVTNELDTIIKFIISKGYNITSLSNLIKE